MDSGSNFAVRQLADVSGMTQGEKQLAWVPAYAGMTQKNDMTKKDRGGKIKINSLLLVREYVLRNLKTLHRPIRASREMASAYQALVVHLLPRNIIRAE